MDMGRPVAPDWVREPAALADVHVLAFRRHADVGSLRHDGMACTAAWLRGVRAAPVTFRDEQPVTYAIAKAEKWASMWVTSDGAKPPLESSCAMLGVPYREPVATDRHYALGVWEVLHWLTADPLEHRPPPLDVPERNPDGSISTADELSAAAVAAEPWRYSLPERRIELRDRSEQCERRSRHLAALIAETVSRDHAPA
jgi:hypothetical protein